MHEKKIVQNDYIDPETGLRFVEDTRGNFHLVHMMNMEDIHIPTPIVNVEAPVINLPPPVITVECGYNYSSNQLVVLQSRTSNHTWLLTTDFNRINLIGSSLFLNYTVPFGKEYHILKILVSQYNTGGLSYAGIFRDGNLFLPIPLISNVELGFESPLKFPAQSFIEFKFMPYTKKTDIGITIIGYTI